MDYATLIAELSSDPVSAGYAEMTDSQVADAMNDAGGDLAATVPYERFGTIRLLMAELGPAETAAIVAAVEGAADSDSQLALAIDMLKTYGEGGGIDFGHATTRALIDGLVNDQTLTAEQGTALKSLGERDVSRAGQLGLPTIKPGYVHKARLQGGLA